MTSYSGKQRIKFVILIAAIAVGIVSFFLLFKIIENVKNEERKKIILWAGAIQKKIELVSYTNKLFEKLEEDERTKVEIWSDAMNRIISASEDEDISFFLKIISTNKNIPIILTNTKGKIVSHINLEFEIEDGTYFTDSLIKAFTPYPPIKATYKNETLNLLYYKDSKLFLELQSVMNNMVSSFLSEVVSNSASVPVIITDSLRERVIASGNIDSLSVSNNEELQKTLGLMATSNTPIEISWINGEKNLIFYEDSKLLKYMRYYPIIFLSIILVFLIIAYLAFTSSRKFEQNQVWVGMSKETAHQLGTPISSLLAWIELLKIQHSDADLTKEIEKDISRLQTIADRFSKIGSNPIKTPENINEVVETALNYMKKRSPKTINFSITTEKKEEIIFLNRSLFEWVIENLSKNAIDAMGAFGDLHVLIHQKQDKIFIDITDSGKGIPRSKFKTIFKPGYTTKQRGWGLGLTLVKRIIEEYHKGKIFVLSSKINVGTTFRIILNKEKV